MRQALVLIILLILTLSGFYFLSLSNGEKGNIGVSSFEACVAEGNAVMESYPRQCRDKAGNLHVEDVVKDWEAVYTNASFDDITVTNLSVGDTIASPITVQGLARGYWFFEASFPIVITDWDGKIIGEGYATALLDPEDPESTWMTTDFVQFTSSIVFETPEQVTSINRGAIILMRDNPSGLPENDAALEVPIVFQ